MFGAYFAGVVGWSHHRELVANLSRNTEMCSRRMTMVLCVVEQECCNGLGCACVCLWSLDAWMWAASLGGGLRLANAACRMM